MTRRLLNLLTVLSLPLCVAVVVLWVRSYSKHQAIWGYTRTALVDVGSADGRLVIVTDPSRPGGTGIQFDAFEQPLSLWREHPWVAECAGDDPPAWPGLLHGPGPHPRGAILPHWVAAALLGLLPIRAVIRRLRWANERIVSACAVCGYDLRATPDRCPECGAAGQGKRRMKAEG